MMILKELLALHEAARSYDDILKAHGFKKVSANTYRKPGDQNGTVRLTKNEGWEHVCDDDTGDDYEGTTESSLDRHLTKHSS